MIESAEPLGERAKVAIGMVATVMLTAAVSLWADLSKYDAVSRVVDGERVSLSELQSVDDRVSTVGVVYGIALVISVVTFLLWYSRAYRNIGPLGVREPRYGPRWAVASWFIPILSLFRPKQVMNDIWRAGDPDLPRVVASLEGRQVTPLLHWWWALWLLSNWVGTLAVRVSFDKANPSAEDLKSQSLGYVFSDIADIVAGVLAILVIRALTARQDERRAKLVTPGEF
ncbi:hypothetical protein BH10ACT11_BH10ACT11_20260 [soil metagenome]